MYPDDAADEDEGHGRHEHHTAVFVAGVIERLRDDLEAQQLTRAEQLAHESYDDQNDGIAQTVAQTVEERIPRVIGHGERLEATHQDTVGDDQTEIDG